MRRKPLSQISQNSVTGLWMTLPGPISRRIPFMDGANQINIISSVSVPCFVYKSRIEVSQGSEGSYSTSTKEVQLFAFWSGIFIADT
jgi:hypothetical protein